MKALDTKLLVERLTKRMDLHRIFLFSYPFLKEEQLHLLLIVNPVKGLPPKAMAPIVSLCMSDTVEISFDMVLVGEWQNQMKQGSLYHSYASLPQHLLFAEVNKKSPSLSSKNITGMLELAQHNYEKCKQSSDEFREAVNNFVAKGDYGQATFMLHQFLEVRLKGFQATVGINGGKSHNIEHLIKLLRGVAPELLSIFPYDGPSVELIRLLDQSYNKGKKIEALEITEEEFNILHEKCALACAEIDGMVAIMVERIMTYRDQLSNTTPADENGKENQQQATPLAKTISASSQQICEGFSRFPWPDQYKRDVNTLLDGIYQMHRPEEVIMLNYHTGGFSGNNLFQQTEEESKQAAKIELYLVVLMKNRGPFRFKCKQQGIANAMVLYLNIDYVKKKLAEGDRFVHTLWTKGTVLRKKSTFSPVYHVAEVDWKAEYERVKGIWENAKACMSNLKEVILETPNLMIDSGLLLLKELLEIGVHTYLQCAVGFIPKRLHLTELIDWSSITSTKLLDFIYPKSETERVRLHLIFRPDRIWWESASIGLSKVSQSFYLDQARDLTRFFDALCGEVLEELEGKVNQVENTTKEPIG